MIYIILILLLLIPTSLYVGYRYGHYKGSPYSFAKIARETKWKRIKRTTYTFMYYSFYVLSVILGMYVGFKIVEVIKWV